MQHDTAYGDFNPDTQPQEALAQGAHLGAGQGGAGRGQAQLLQQDVGRGGQEYAQLIGKASACNWCGRSPSRGGVP